MSTGGAVDVVKARPYPVEQLSARRRVVAASNGQTPFGIRVHCILGPFSSPHCSDHAWVPMLWS